MFQTRDEGKGCVGGDTDDNGFYRETPLKMEESYEKKKNEMQITHESAVFCG